MVGADPDSELYGQDATGTDAAVLYASTSKRDGVKASPDDIFLTDGASQVPTRLLTPFRSTGLGGVPNWRGALWYSVLGY
eukprot:289771-Rhodomonas_salina.1